MTQSTELATRPADVLLPGSPEQVRAAMTAYLETTQAALTPSDWQGEPNQPGSFIRKSGWQKIAKAYALSTSIVGETVDRDPETGEVTRAAAVVRALGPNGQYREASGYCARSERRFATADGRQKLEHDLRATAVTRAENRAISNLCGLGAVSAEEATEDSPVDAVVVEIQVPAWAAPIPDEDVFAEAITRLCVALGKPEPEAMDLAMRLGQATLRECDATVPKCLHLYTRRLLHVANTPTDPEPQEATA